MTSLKNTIENEDTGDKEEEKGEEEGGDSVVKKKRKRNVEARDAWTQTDRSDYMLIKYRQKQKQFQMAKSQKCKSYFDNLSL